MPSADAILDFAPIVLIALVILSVFIARYLEGKFKRFK